MERGRSNIPKNVGMTRGGDGVELRRSRRDRPTWVFRVMSREVRDADALTRGILTSRIPGTRHRMDSTRMRPWVVVLSG